MITRRKKAIPDQDWTLYGPSTVNAEMLASNYLCGQLSRFEKGGDNPFPVAARQAVDLSDKLGGFDGIARGVAIVRPDCSHSSLESQSEGWTTDHLAMQLSSISTRVYRAGERLWGDQAMTPALPPVCGWSAGLLYMYMKAGSARADTTANEVPLKVKHNYYIPT